jgi:hypothetical protein
MNDRSPRLVSRLRIFVPLAVLVLILAGASAAFASGAFESNDSGFDSARDVAERGAVDASTTTTSLPGADDANDDKRVDPAPVSGVPTQNQSQDQSTVIVPEGGTSTFGAGDAGSVTIRRTGGTLSIVSVDANAGWVSEVEQGTGAEVEVKFVNGTTRIDFKAELEDGGVRVRVRASTEAPGTSNDSSDDNSGPGNVTDDRGTGDNSGPGSVDDGNSGHGSSNSGHGSSDHSSDG